MTPRTASIALRRSVADMESMPSLKYLSSSSAFTCAPINSFADWIIAQCNHLYVNGGLTEPLFMMTISTFVPACWWTMAQIAFTFYRVDLSNRSLQSQAAQIVPNRMMMQHAISQGDGIDPSIIIPKNTAQAE